MTITSTAFQNGDDIPKEYTTDGDNINPPLTFSEVPGNAKSLVLIVDDPDAPHPPFTHWMLYDMSPATLQILEHSTPQTGKQGKNGFAKNTYGGPAPPNGTHRYFFKLFALDTVLKLPEGATRQELDTAINGHILEDTAIMARYTRNVPAPGDHHIMNA